MRCFMASRKTFGGAYRMLINLGYSVLGMDFFLIMKGISEVVRVLPRLEQIESAL